MYMCGFTIPHRYFATTFHAAVSGSLNRCLSARSEDWAWEEKAMVSGAGGEVSYGGTRETDGGLQVSLCKRCDDSDYGSNLV